MLVSKSELDAQRDLEIVREPVKCAQLIKKHFAGSTMLLSGFEPPPKVKLIEQQDPNHIIVDFGFLQASLGQKYVLYTVLANYAHICARMVQDKIKGGRYALLVIDHLAIAKKNRDVIRIPVMDDSIFISNFRVSKNEINLNTQRIPTFVKLGFAELKNILAEKADYVTVDFYKARNTANPSLSEQICEKARPLLLRNTADPASYTPFNHSYFDLSAYLKKDIQSYMAESKKKGILSEIYIPVLYPTRSQTPFPLGYIHMQSKTKHFSPQDVQEVWQITKNTIQRIRASNTLLISEREAIIDLSREGLKAHIKNPVLIEHISKQKAFTFDVFFHMQAPVTLYGVIRSLSNLGKDIQLGVKIVGNSSRAKEMERFNENVEILEKKYLSSTSLLKKKEKK